MLIPLAAELARVYVMVLAMMGAVDVQEEKLAKLAMMQALLQENLKLALTVDQTVIQLVPDVGNIVFQDVRQLVKAIAAPIVVLYVLWDARLDAQTIALVVVMILLQRVQQ